VACASSWYSGTSILLDAMNEVWGVARSTVASATSPRWWPAARRPCNCRPRRTARSGSTLARLPGRLTLRSRCEQNGVESPAQPGWWQAYSASWPTRSPDSTASWSTGMHVPPPMISHVASIRPASAAPRRESSEYHERELANGSRGCPHLRTKISYADMQNHSQRTDHKTCTSVVPLRWACQPPRDYRHKPDHAKPS
jgi:hypothetical protein